VDKRFSETIKSGGVLNSIKGVFTNKQEGKWQCRPLGKSSNKIEKVEAKIFQKGLTQAGDEFVANKSGIQIKEQLTFDSLSESEAVTGDPKAMKKSAIPQNGEQACYNITFTDATVNGDFVIRIGKGRMDLHYSTLFLDPKLGNQTITLRSEKLNGEVKPCVGAMPGLRAQDLRAAIKHMFDRHSTFNFTGSKDPGRRFFEDHLPLPNGTLLYSNRNCMEVDA
jgi:hypothetical protein